MWMRAPAILAGALFITVDCFAVKIRSRICTDLHGLDLPGRLTINRFQQLFFRDNFFQVRIKNPEKQRLLRLLNYFTDSCEKRR